MWVLLFMYIGLTLLYAFRRGSDSPKIPTWPLVKTEEAAVDGVVTPCTDHRDCPTDHVCVERTCLPKLLRGGECHESTGKWVAHSVGGVNVAVCECSDHSLYTQRIFGGDCDASVGCGVHGTYNPVEKECDCHYGYREVNRHCVKKTVFENMEWCDDGEIEKATEADGFHADYLGRVGKCVRKPCSFDALTGRPLRHAEFKQGWGCVCDPRYGLFGVVLEGEYLNAEGFNACASIFVKDPPLPLEVKLVTYFYLGKLDPISLVLFEGLNDQDLVPVLRGRGESLAITQSPWRYDYAQYFFKTNPNFNARTRTILMPLRGFMTEMPNEHDWVNYFEPFDCFDVSLMWRNARIFNRSTAYKALYGSPVCRVRKNDQFADEQFWDRVVVNPMQLIFEEYENLKRFNSFVLYYEKSLSRWSLDLDYRHEIDKYRALETNVPKYPLK